MISSINNINHSTNFRAIVRVKMLSIKNATSEACKTSDNPKEIKSALVILIRLLSKKIIKADIKLGELESTNSTLKETNNTIRKIFESRIQDYIIPDRYTKQTKETDDYEIRKIEANGQYFILTGKHAKMLNEASRQILHATFQRNSNIFEDVNLLEVAKINYGNIKRNLLNQIDCNTPTLNIWGEKKLHSTKVIPKKISFD